MDKLELYKSFYDRENQRRESLNNSVSIPVGIITGLIATLVFLITRFNYGDNLLYTWSLIILVLISIILLSISIAYLTKSFNNFAKGHDYIEIALLSDIENYYDELLKYHKNKIDKVDHDFQNYLCAEFIKYADNNARINDKRSFDLYKSKQFMFFSIVFLAFSFIPFGFGNYKTPEKVPNQQIEKINANKELDLKIDSLLNVKLKQIENERTKTDTKGSSKADSTATKATDREISKGYKN